MPLAIPLYDRTSEGNCAFLGLRMWQNRLDVPVLSYVLETSGFVRVVELGTQLGGLSVLLGLQCRLLGVQMHTFDKEDSSPYGEWLDHFGVERHLVDIFSPAGEAQVRELVEAPGRSLLLCDNGDKAREFRTFAPRLKAGDVIGAHDYHPDGDYDERRWAWREIGEKDVRETCEAYGLLPYLQEAATEAAWVLRIRS